MSHHLTNVVENIFKKLFYKVIPQDPKAESELTTNSQRQGTVILCA